MTPHSQCFFSPVLCIYCALIPRLHNHDSWCNFKEKPLSLLTISKSIKALSHLADLARRSYTGAQICWFLGIGMSRLRQHNGITSVRTVVLHQDIVRTLATKLATAGHGRTAGVSNGTTTAVLWYDFVNVGRAPVAPRNGSAALRWPQ